MKGASTFRMLLDRLDGEEAPGSAVITKSPQSLLSVLRFTSQILFPKYPHALFPLLFILRMHSLKRSGEVVLKCVPRELFRSLVPGPLQGDVESSILIGHGLLDTLKVSGPRWLQLARPSHSTATLVRATPIAGLPHAVALATEDLWHNVHNRLGLTTAESLVIVDYVKFTSHIASKVVLGLLRPTCNLESSLMDASLDVFFQRPRYLCVGDIFSVYVEKYESGHCSVESLYFKVVEFEGPNYTKELSSSDRNIVVGFHVVKGHTAVVQASDQNEFLPPRTHIFVPGPCQVTGENYRSFLLPACPPGPDRCCGELVSLLQPFLSGKRPGLPALRIRPVFLLRGPCGSGKRTAAHAAARSLGLRMWEVDCLELCGSSPGQAEGKLKFVFTRAKQYSPCIVLLRNIHVRRSVVWNANIKLHSYLFTINLL
ncbi:hypothetical protein PR048_004466 [Dryococelus australis]|uniref:ATPase AAA-type core domain-containing protein n=1 Tax=Dryococelus australis TaxID=614101 RepID=A0ABQ9I6J0_9NEOP|nr:hypothetical protein PR048_004466 [Dryococelus australis]